MSAEAEEEEEEEEREEDPYKRPKGDCLLRPGTPRGGEMTLSQEFL